MNMLTYLMESPHCIALGWTVLHSLWQGLLLALLFKALLLIGHQWRAQIQYRLAFLTLCTQLFLFIGTAWWLWPNHTQPPMSTDTGDSAVVVVVTAAQSAAAAIPTLWESWLTSLVPVIALLWLMGMVFFLVRLWLGYSATRSIRRSAETAPPAWQGIFSQLCTDLGIRRSVSLGTSEQVESPVLMGLFRPLILIPVGLINQLTTEEVSAILRHELAHLKRFDPIFYFFQLLIEAIFYYHPTVWWLGQEVRRLREEACDEEALQAGAAPLPYAKTLLKLSELARPVPSPPLSLAMGADQSERLLRRIQRILHTSQQQPDMKEKMLVTGLLLMGTLFVSLAATWPSSQTNTWDRDASVSLVGITDTFPKGNIFIEREEDDGTSLSVKIKDQAIQELIIDGKEIPPSEYDQYVTQIEEMVNNVPPPPAPPAPPSGIAPPAPPAPPSGVAPPAPPAPPAPSRIIIKEKRSIKNNEEGPKTVFSMDSEDIDEIEIFEIDGEQTVVMKTKNVDGEEVVKTYTIDTDDEINIHTDGTHKVIHRQDGKQVWVAEDGGRQVIIKTKKDGQEKDIHVFKMVGDDEAVIEIDGQVIRAEDLEREIVVEVETMMEKMEIDVEEMEKQIEEAMQEIEVTVEQIELSAMDDSDWGRQLQADGLIEDAGNYNLKLNNKRMKVNGKTMPAATHERYMDLYEERTGETFSERTSINVMRRMRGE